MNAITPIHWCWLFSKSLLSAVGPDAVLDGSWHVECGPSSDVYS